MNKKGDRLAMFTSSRVQHYLSGFSGHGDDPDNKELKLSCHVENISHELLSEISPLLANRVFSETIDPETGGKVWEALREIKKADFSNLQIQLQNITFHNLPEDGVPMADAGVLVEGCSISNLRVVKANALSHTFRLEYDVVIAMDHVTMDLVERFYKAYVYLTMEQVQRQLELTIGNDLTSALQNAADSEADGKSAGAGEGRKRRRKKTEEKQQEEEAEEVTA
jgi:hypothetical protein